MRNRNKLRFKYLVGNPNSPRSFGCMRGTIKFIGDIESPVWDEPWDAELGIAYRGEDGPIYYTGNGIETTDDLL